MIIFSILNKFSEPLSVLFQLSGPSMEPTFHTGDLIIGERRPKNITYGNILVVRSPFDPECYIVKRLMGLPGDIKRHRFTFCKVRTFLGVSFRLYCGVEMFPFNHIFISCISRFPKDICG